MSRFRTEYRELSLDEKTYIRMIKDSAGLLEIAINNAPDGREKSLALTKLEEAVMWAVKGITG